MARCNCAWPGDEVNVISIDDYLQLPANGLLTNETMHRRAAGIGRQGMVRAMLRGIRYTLDNPDEAFEISLKYRARSRAGTRDQSRDLRRLPAISGRRRRAATSA